MCRNLYASCLCALAVSGCAGLDLAKADVCLRKKLEVTIPFGGGEFVPKKCTSKEVFNRIFT